MSDVLLNRLGRVIFGPASGGVWIKVVGIAVIAAVPIVILAGVVVAQTLASSDVSALQTSDLLESTAVASFEAAKQSLNDAFLSAVERIDEAPAECLAVLQAEVTRASPKIAGALVLGQDNAVQCAANGPGALARFGDFGRATWPDYARGHHRLVLVKPPGSDAVIAARADGGGVIAGLLPRDWPDAVLPDQANFNASTWLLDPSGSILAVRGRASQSLPTRQTLQTLLRGPRAAVLAQSVQGRPFAYTSSQLADGWRLIEAYQTNLASDVEAGALLTRLAALAVLLLMAFGAIILGAGMTFGEPLLQLSRAASRWQNGGAFEPGPLAGAPWEVRDLARSFQDATIALRAREADLLRAKEQQDLLVLEIHHRVKNNLQIVASLLNLQASRIRVPEARAEFQAARDRVRALATLHRHLYSDGELHTINMRSFLVELCDQLFQAIGEASDDRITLSIKAPELRMSSDQAVPLALIVTEAVTNAVKYAFPDGRRGHISVSLSDHGDDLDLVIRDDGVGITAGVAETAAGTRDGIGRQLIRGFARQLGASLTVEEGPGTCYAVRLSLKPPSVIAVPEPLDAA